MAESSVVLPPVGKGSMTTATEYRQYARECMDSARDATSAPVRDQFIELEIVVDRRSADGHSPNVVQADEQ